MNLKEFKIGKLSSCDELILANRIKMGDENARNSLVEANLDLVKYLLRSYLGRSDYDDLMQEGIIALIRAAEKYEAHMNNRFSTYATPWVREAIKRSTGKQENIKIPDYIIEKWNKYTRFQTDYFNKFAKKPALMIIAQHFGDSVSMVERVLNAKIKEKGLYSTVGEELNLSETIASEGLSADRIYENRVRDRNLKSAIDKLDYRSRVIIEERFFNNSSLDCLAKNFNLSIPRVSQIEKSALNKLRMILGDGLC